jgi:aminoglycoside phosphotransferase (APT) family kinase protein
MSGSTTSPGVIPLEQMEPPQDTGSDSASIASSEVSTTSTEMFEHEPFDTFQLKVVGLCQKEWPQLSKDAFSITRMDGGSYNRVISIQVDGSRKQAGWLQCQVRQVLRSICSGMTRKADIKRYVLRVPRQEHAWVEYEVSILKFLVATSIPVPRVRTFSFSAESPIGSPHMIQPRLPGNSVIEVYSKLNTQQRISFAQDLGSALLEMTKIQSPCPGTLNPDSILAGSSDKQLLQLQCPPKNAFRHTDEPFVAATPQTVYEFLISQFARQRAFDLTLNRKYLNPWKPFTSIIQHLHTLGFLKDDIFTLAHMDFEPRNMLIHVTSPTTAKLSAILDWDESVFAPAFTNCRPPYWLWDFEGDDEPEEVNANVTPKDLGLAAVKKAFDDAAGEEYCKWAYTTEYRIARDIARLSIMGIWSNMDYDDSRAILEEWNTAYPQFEVCGISDFEEDEQ